MALQTIAALVRKDLQVFLTDRRAVLMAFVVPIAIASFFGSVFSGAGSTSRARVKVTLVQQDDSAVARALVAAVSGDENLTVTMAPADEARERVRRGRTVLAVVVPPGFGDAAGRAMFSGGEKPALQVWYDPSHEMERAMVGGLLTQHVMESVTKEMFAGDTGRKYVDETLAGLDQSAMSERDRGLLRDMLSSVRRFYAEPSDAAGGASGATQARRGGFSMPFVTKVEAVTAGAQVPYNAYAHSFAGMGVQFLLFAAIDLGVGILLERQRGLWKRLRAAPVSRRVLLAGKAASGTLIALITLLVSFAFAMVVFKVRIAGSLPGFLLVSCATAMMVATFGLLIASLGRTPAATRGVSTLATLLMVMLGGAWVPTFVFPAWLQQVTVVVPARWAVDGLDAMSWRGVGLSGAMMPTAVLLGFSVLFGALAMARFRWEEES